VKRLLMLGGSAAQVNAIKHAKKLGLHVILCDYLTDNPGQHFADEYIPASTTDEKAILQIAEKKKIDGIVAYASDPAAPTAAFVGNKLGLPSNPYESVVTLCRKDLFRDFLRKNGFQTPRMASFPFNAQEEAFDFFNSLKSEAIIKPVDSSGSKGISIIKDTESFYIKFEHATTFSRCKKIIIEELIESKCDKVLEPECFLRDGNLAFSCYLNSHRDHSCGPLVPTGPSFPSIFSKEIIDASSQTIISILKLLKMNMGALNIEFIVDKRDNPWLIEIGPRNGGNLLPELILSITGVDMIDVTIKSALGMNCIINSNTTNNTFIATHVIHSRKAGFLKGLSFSHWLEERIFYRLFYKKPGDPVERFEGANQAIGIIMMRFSSEDEMHETLDTIYERHINLGVEN